MPDSGFEVDEVHTAYQWVQIERIHYENLGVDNFHNLSGNEPCKSSHIINFDNGELLEHVRKCSLL